MNKIINSFLIVMGLFIVTNCKEQRENNMIMKESLGTLDNKEVSIFTLTNKNGNSIKLTNYGAAISEIMVPDKTGAKANVTFGFETLEQYIKGELYFGKVVGQYANRIAKGKFSIDDTEYSLEINNAPNSLHGTDKGWHSRVWDVEILKDAQYPSVKFTYNKQDMEQGFPGNVVASVIYTWTDNNELRLDYHATTDKKTIINMTNHAYFNLGGTGSGNILDHEVVINASKFTPVDSTLIPTGEMRAVTNTPFDFLTTHKVGERINENYDQLIIGKGYDHNFILDGNTEVAASAYHSPSGRFMEVITDQPGIQFYTGNFLDGSQVGRGNVQYNFRDGLCFETQHYPDSPNQPDFPSVIITPDKPFNSYTIYRFSTR